MMANAWRICQAMGIRLHKRTDAHQGELPPKHTWARKTIKDVAEAGERVGYPEHIYDVLGLFLQGERNQCQLYGDNIYGVSRWMMAANLRTEHVPYIAPAFQEIDLGLIRSTVSYYRIPQRPPQIAILLAGVMHDAVEAVTSSGQ